MTSCDVPYWLGKRTKHRCRNLHLGDASLRESPKGKAQKRQYLLMVDLSRCTTWYRKCVKIPRLLYKSKRGRVDHLLVSEEHAITQFQLHWNRQEAASHLDIKEQDIHKQYYDADHQF